jgi:group I intron endonuclease
MFNDYYTYAYLREDRTPYYIGKGRGRRIYSPNRIINPPADKSRIIFLKKNLTEAEAFKHEVYMIFVLGRKDLGTGILRNLTNGGEGSSGAIRSEEAKKKLSLANTGENHPQFGIPRTKETKKKISVANSGENHPRFGIPRTEAQKQSASKKLSGALSPRSRAIIAIKPDGTELHFGGVREAARELEINHSNLSNRYLKNDKVLEQGPFKGWRFVYDNS